MLQHPETGAHAFDTTGEAYDAIQCDESIRKGDRLLIVSEAVVGLAHTWPIAVTVEHGELHQPQDGADIVTLLADAGLTVDQVLMAMNLADANSLPVATWARRHVLEHANSEWVSTDQLASGDLVSVHGWLLRLTTRRVYPAEHFLGEDTFVFHVDCLYGNRPDDLLPAGLHYHVQGNSRARWVRLVAPCIEPSGVRGYEGTLAEYRRILEANPGKALVIGDGSVALLQDGNLVGASASETAEGLRVDLDTRFDFDRSAWDTDNDCWDADDSAMSTAEHIANPWLIQL
ncbi:MULTISPECIES: hypothetical protein [unclassified Pseudomonas]|uniref:hypothetical protein n=1 Tax=unclassified Pseudomonas TaxID=196821 RepID=UPI00131EC33B|nr:MULTISPECIES: hypothetical protein [unclassified Pseudomonas]